MSDKLKQLNKKYLIFIFIALMVIFLVLFFVIKGNKNSGKEPFQGGEGTETTPITEPSEPSAITTIDMSPYEDAVAVAKDLLRVVHTSRQDLIDRIMQHGFSREESTYGADHSGADWVAYAVEFAEHFLKENVGAGETALFEELTSQGYTEAESKKALQSLKNVDWEFKAMERAKEVVEFFPISKHTLLLRLTGEGYSEETAKKVVESMEIDWKEQAVKFVQYEIKYMFYSRAELRERVKGNMFTAEEVNYAMENSKVDWKNVAFRFAEYFLEGHEDDFDFIQKELEKLAFTQEEILDAINRIKSIKTKEEK